MSQLIAEAVSSLPEAALRGEKIQVHFRVRNPTSHVVNVVKALVGCGASVEPSLFRLRPGEVVDVKAVFNSTSLPEKQLAELIIQLQTDEPGAATLRFAAQAIVTSEFQTSVRYLDLGAVPQSEQVMRQFAVAVGPDVIARPVDVRSTDPLVQVELTALPTSTSMAYEVTVTRALGAPVGAHFGNVVIRTSSIAMPEIRIPLEGVVTSR